MAPGAVQALVCLALCLNLALTYVLMLAPSRQYLEDALVAKLAVWRPHVFGAPRRHVLLLAPPRGVRSVVAHPQDPEACGHSSGNGSDARRKQQPHMFQHQQHQQQQPQPVEEEADETDLAALGDGRWTPGEGWRTGLVRNLVRAALVVFTAYLSLAIPHFGILAGLIGGMTDASQSLVLPPLIYRLELGRRGPSVFARPLSPGKALVLQWACLGLALFGACFIALSTYANIKGLLTIL